MSAWPRSPRRECRPDWRPCMHDSGACRWASWCNRPWPGNRRGCAQRVAALHGAHPRADCPCQRRQRQAVRPEGSACRDSGTRDPRCESAAGRFSRQPGPRGFRPVLSRRSRRTTGARLGKRRRSSHPGRPGRIPPVVASPAELELPRCPHLVDAAAGLRRHDAGADQSRPGQSPARASNASPARNMSRRWSARCNRPSSSGRNWNNRNCCAAGGHSSAPSPG
jgi:hypothetical protein